MIGLEYVVVFLTGYHSTAFPEERKPGFLSGSMAESVAITGHTVDGSDSPVRKALGEMMPGTVEKPDMTCKGEGPFCKSQERRYCSQVGIFLSLDGSPLGGNSFVLCVNLVRVECLATESDLDLGSVGMAFVEVTQDYKQCTRRGAHESSNSKSKLYVYSVQGLMVVDRSDSVVCGP
ncbi:hypothetical protein STEG23_001703 [Scotinomys teguina]